MIFRLGRHLRQLQDRFILADEVRANERVRERREDETAAFSDIDLIVHSKDGRQWRPDELEALMLVLREAFCRHRICTQEGVQLLNGATVPIIKLTDRRTDVKVDMSFNMNNGLRSAQLILVRRFDGRTADEHILLSSSITWKSTRR